MYDEVVTEEVKDFKMSYKKLFASIKVYRWGIIAAVVLATISSVLAIIGPDRIKRITDLIVEGIMSGVNMDKIISIPIFLAVIYGLSSIFDYIQGYIMATIANRYAYKLRNEISFKINKLPLKYFDKTSYGDVLSRVTNDVDTVANTLSQSFVSLIGSLTMVIGSVILMFWTNWIMAIAAIISSLVGFILIGVIITRSQKYFVGLQKNLGDLNGHIEEIYSSHNVVKAYNGMDDAEEKFANINDDMFENVHKSQFLSGLMQPLGMFAGNLGFVVVCIVGALLTMNGAITFGVIVAFMIYVRLFLNPLGEMAGALAGLQPCIAASERVFEFLDEEEQTSEDNIKQQLNIKDAKGNIEFKNVKFSYEPKKPIIKDFSAITKSGDKIAIVGPTGAGKTTMVNLLMKFYEINDGDIIIDGKSSKELTRRNIHDLFIMVLQDTWVFEGTIKENVRYNKEDVTDEQIIDACKVVGIHHFITTLPDGYDTVLKDNESLSAGQKQLLTIARGMSNDAPFLILDEATSSVDTRTEVLVQKAMDRLTDGRTSFIIAHRLSTIKNADLILVMNEGNIIEQGNHEELLDKEGFYADLYNSQFSDGVVSEELT